jgi:hypothetical protein
MPTIQGFRHRVLPYNDEGSSRAHGGKNNKDYDDQSNKLTNRDAKYDIVIGPVANDDLALLFRQFTDGWIDVAVLAKEMEYKKLTDQYSFHTPKAIASLFFIGVGHD